MGLKLLPRKRYRVGRYHLRDWHEVPSEAGGPEATHLYWRRRGAAKEQTRLTRIAARAGLPYAYRVQKIYGK